MANERILYDYWRSSAAYRVRIALNLKGLPYASLPVNLLKGEQHAPAYRALNPQGAVPMLVDGGERITQSLAILEYLEEIYPTPSLLPRSAVERAHARAFAQVVVSDMHPLNNLRVLRYLEHTLHADEPARSAWMAEWLHAGLRTLEALARDYGSGAYCIGDSATLADCCLIPQLYSARRYRLPLDAYPTLTAIDAHCTAQSAFAKAAPDRQPDAVA